jgi:hypothetical protein
MLLGNICICLQDYTVSKPNWPQCAQSYDIYFSLNSVGLIRSRRVGWSRHVARMEIKNEYKTVIGKLEVKRSLGRHSHSLEDNIKIYINTYIWCYVNVRAACFWSVNCIYIKLYIYI